MRRLAHNLHLRAGVSAAAAIVSVILMWTLADLAQATPTRAVHCGSKTTNSYYIARKITAKHLNCRSARKVARAAARTIAQLGVDVGDSDPVGLNAAGSGWFCSYRAKASDSPFRVKCVEQDVGRGRVDFTASPSE